MSTWINIEIGKVIKFNPSESIKKGSFAKKIPMDKLKVFDRKITGFELAEYSAGPKFRNGDTLVAKITPCLENGKTAQVDILENDEVAFGSSEFIVLRETEDTINDYIFYLAKSPAFRKKAIGCMEGTSGRKRVNEGALKLQVLPFPDKETQKDIAKVLSGLDAKIELNNKINTELEAMAKTLYDYWFVQFDFPDENGKPYKSSGGKMVWNEELKREIPEGWKVETLLDIATFTNGLACQKFRPEAGEKSYKVIKIREMGTGFTANSEFVSKNIPKKVVINNGDVLFSWSATLDVKIWTGGIGALNQHIFRITSKKFPRSYYFFELLNYLQHFKMQAELRKTTMGHITQEHLKQSKITVPPIDLLNQLDNIIKPILDKKVKLEEENQELASLRDWLLPMLMNGQVSVREIEELGMVAEAKSSYGKVVAMFSECELEENYYEKRKALAMYIINKSLSDKFFGDTKLMKLLHLADYHAVKRNLGQNYFQNVAGPFDGEFKNRFLREIQEEGIFKVEKPNTKYIFKKGINHSKSLEMNDYFSNSESQKVDSLISYFAKENYERPEIFSTLYAVWNNRLIKNEDVSPKLLKKDFLDWDKSKAKYANQVFEELDNMKMIGILPDGWGRYIGKAKSKY